MRDDPGEHLERRLQIVRDDPRARRAQLVDHQLEPELGRLVDHDEQHLVVAVRDRALTAQQAVELEIAAVGQLAREVGRDAGLEVGRRVRSCHGGSLLELGAVPGALRP